MREFDQLRAFVPPLVLVPGVPTVDEEVVGYDTDTNPTKEYEVANNGWEGYVKTTGPIASAPSSEVLSPFVFIYGVHEQKVRWSPYARMDIAAVPISHDVADGTLPQAFYQASTAFTVLGDAFPVFEGAFTKILDIWTTEKLDKNQRRNLTWNGILFGTEPGYFFGANPFTAYSTSAPLSAHMIRSQPTDKITTGDRGLRFDQIISARYRTFGVPVGSSDSHSLIGGYQPLMHDNQIGGNAAMSEDIYHYRVFFCAQSTTNQVDSWHWRDTGTGYWTWNYLKSGLKIPSSIDTLTIGMEKIESDAEWATLARRGANRR